MDDSVEELPVLAAEGVNERVTLADEHALVTGAGNGMGRMVAATFAAAGADVTISDRLEDDLVETADELRDAFNVTINTVVADVSKPDQVATLVSKTTADDRGLDILLNVAGVSTYEDSERLSVQTWDFVQQVNLRGTFLMAREVFPHLQDGGRIVNVSSIAGLYGASSMSHYGAAKAGIRNLTRSLAREWAADNIRVNAVAPGPILTPGAGELFDKPEEAPLDRDAITREIGSPAEVADTMLFLASPASSYVSGETIRVGGAPPTQEDISITSH